MTAQDTPTGVYFSAPLAAHLVAVGALGLMYAQNMAVLGGLNTVVMMSIVQVFAVALHATAWARAARMSFGARSVLVVLALLGPLYTLLVFALYVFTATQQPVLQAIPLVLVVTCLGCMGLALRRP